jgi:hypothetical protein
MLILDRIRDASTDHNFVGFAICTLFGIDGKVGVLLVYVEDSIDMVVNLHVSSLLSLEIFIHIMDLLFNLNC